MPLANDLFENRDLILISYTELLELRDIFLARGMIYSDVVLADLQKKTFL